MTKRTDRPEDTCCEGCYGMTWIPELDRRFILCNNPRSGHYGHVLDSRHSCQEFGIIPPADEDWFNSEAVTIVLDSDPIRRYQTIKNYVKGQYGDRISPRAIACLTRLTINSIVNKRSLESYTDKEILVRRNVGHKILAEIRTVIPRPEGKNDGKE